MSAVHFTDTCAGAQQCCSSDHCLDRPAHDVHTFTDPATLSWREEAVRQIFGAPYLMQRAGREFLRKNDETTVRDSLRLEAGGTRDTVRNIHIGIVAGIADPAADSVQQFFAGLGDYLTLFAGVIWRSVVEIWA